MGRLPVGVAEAPGSTGFSTIPCGHSFKGPYSYIQTKRPMQMLNGVDGISPLEPSNDANLL